MLNLYKYLDIYESFIRIYGGSAAFGVQAVQIALYGNSLRLLCDLLEIT